MVCSVGSVALVAPIDENVPFSSIQKTVQTKKKQASLVEGGGFCEAKDGVS